MKSVSMWNARLGAWVRSLAMACALALATLVPAQLAHAVDRVTLKEGNKVLEGEIVREVEGYIWLKYKIGAIEKEEMITPDKIAKIERGGSSTPAPAVAVAGAAATPVKGDKPATGGKTPKAVVITLGDRTNGDMVGVYFTAHALKGIVPELEKELGTDRTGVVVFRIYSGGGMAIEVPKMHQVIREEFMPRWRTVAWVESSISAAAMTPHCIEEIYFTPQANYGACTMFSGNLVMSRGYALENVLQQMERVSRQAGYDPLIMRSMQIPDPLSATIQPDGTVKFYPDETSGEILVNRKGEILTLNAETAKQIKFSKGTADTLKDLERLMGYQELDWVGENVKGVAWPVSPAERTQMEFRVKTKRDEERTRDYFQRYQTALQVAAQQQDRDARVKAVGKARQALDDIKGMIRNNPNFIIQIFGTEDENEYKKWLEEQEKRLRELSR